MDERIDKIMNIKQQEVAQMNMVVSDLQELGKKPSKIEFVKKFELYEMHYYIFKFKRSVFTSWLFGVSGGYVDNDLVPCGHTFSDMKKYNATTVQNDCIDMIERIRSYWMEQAKSYT